MTQEGALGKTLRHLFAQFQALHNFAHTDTHRVTITNKGNHSHSHTSCTGLPLCVSGCLSDSPFAVRVIQAPTSSLCSPCSAHISISPLPTHILLISQSFQAMPLSQNLSFPCTPPCPYFCLSSMSFHTGTRVGQKEPGLQNRSV